jgi:uncharacterized protein (DUF4415 family)
MSSSTTGKAVSFNLDPSSPPALTKEQAGRLDAMTDDDINYSDIPSQSGRDWYKPGALITDSKQQVTLRIDRDVLAYFRSGGRRYQTRINAVLRAFVEAQRD